MLYQRKSLKKNKNKKEVKLITKEELEELNEETKQTLKEANTILKYWELNRRERLGGKEWKKLMNYY